jgi:TetR/AcrR family transcriptional regulator, upper aerobic nicotinate degradation pathway regulator
MANETDMTVRELDPPRGRATSRRKKAAKTRRRTRAPDQTREALLRAAVAEFAREGYGGARVDRISKAAKSSSTM